MAFGGQKGSKGSQNGVRERPGTVLKIIGKTGCLASTNQKPGVFMGRETKSLALVRGRTIKSPALFWGQKKQTVGACWGRTTKNSGLFGNYLILFWNHFVIILGSFWLLGSVWDDFGIIWG